MSNPLQAKYYADQATQDTVEVIENLPIARDTFRLRFRCHEMARRIVPGQFLMLRLSGYDDPLIARPLALYDVVALDSQALDSIDVVYLVKGKLTSRLARFRPGQWLDVWGPLGNGFSPVATRHVIMVAGGIGQTPFLALAKEYLGVQSFGDPARQRKLCGQVTLCYGARSADLLAGLEDFERLGVALRIATDDGSRGHHGWVTDLLTPLFEAPTHCHVVCCGPEPMMEAVSRMTYAAGVSCEVSLETPMACGIGICFTCVAKVREPSGDWDYRRTCVEGPVFDARLIEW